MNTTMTTTTKTKTATNSKVPHMLPIVRAAMAENPTTTVDQLVDILKKAGVPHPRRNTVKDYHSHVRKAHLMSHAIPAVSPSAPPGSVVSEQDLRALVCLAKRLGGWQRLIEVVGLLQDAAEAR